MLRWTLLLVLLAAPAWADPSGSQWELREWTSDMDDSAGASLSVRADRDVQAWLKAPRPVLFVSCSEGRSGVYVWTGTAPHPELGLHRQASVRLRLDDGRPERDTWSESTDNEALLSRRGLDLAKRLLIHDELTFEFTPFKANTQAVKFDIRGLAARAGPVSTACGWGEAVGSAAAKRRMNELTAEYIGECGSDLDCKGRIYRCQIEAHYDPDRFSSCSAGADDPGS